MNRDIAMPARECCCISADCQVNGCKLARTAAPEQRIVALEKEVAVLKLRQTETMTASTPLSLATTLRGIVDQGSSRACRCLS